MTKKFTTKKHIFLKKEVRESIKARREWKFFFQRSTYAHLLCQPFLPFVRLYNSNGIKGDMSE